MVAVLKPVEKSLLDIMREDIGHGAPGAWLEAPEIPQWTREIETDAVEHTIAALNKQADDKQLERFGALLDACCGDITADQLMEMRDIIRSVRLDYSIGQAQKILEDEGVL